eukprot:gene33437-43217_t
MAWKLLLETPLRAARGWRPNILMDALDESGGDGRMLSLLVDLDNAVPSEEEEEERNGTNASLAGGIHPELFQNTRHLDDGHGADHPPHAGELHEWVTAAALPVGGDDADGAAVR